MPRPLTAGQLIQTVGGKGLVIPAGGWTAEEFAKHGQAMLIALTRLAKITQRRVAPVVAATASRIFRRQLKEVIAIVERRAGGKAHGKANVDLFVASQESLWQEAINEVFKEAGIEIVTEIMPPIQSVLGQGYSKTSILMGHEAYRDAGSAIAKEARAIGARIVSVNDTTRNNIIRSVRLSISNGKTVAETAAALEESVPTIFGNRALTIARTELNNAWTQGAAKAISESSTVTHVSVIGCEAREANSPHYHGESTCNYEDLPVSELEDFLSVGFHPNHTGNIVPSGFRNGDGTDDQDQDRPPILDSINE